jgi:hypothetical protein
MTVTEISVNMELSRDDAIKKKTSSKKIVYNHEQVPSFIVCQSFGNDMGVESLEKCESVEIDVVTTFFPANLSTKATW